MKHIQTRESVRAAESCYSDEKIDQLVPLEGNTPRQVAELPISDDDRLWGLIYSCGASKELLIDFACRCARHVAPYLQLTGLDTVEAWLRGEATLSDCDLVACEACHDTRYTVSDIAEAVGYGSIYEVCGTAHCATSLRYLRTDGKAAEHKKEAEWQINTLVSMLEADTYKGVCK